MRKRQAKASATVARHHSPVMEYQKRWWVAVLAMLAPLPLPFNEMLGWPLLIGFWAAIALFLRELENGRTAWLPNWSMNLLGLAYLPVFYIDLSLFFDGRLLPPLIHLALFVLTVKLFALKGDRDHWHALMAGFFLFLASMGTSVHPTIIVYLLVFLVVAMVVLARFAGGHVQALYGGPTAAPVRSRAFLGFGTIMTLVVAVPLFAILPRFDTPYFFQQGASGPRQSRMTGFTEQMSLDGIGRIRTSREVVMRLKYDSDASINANDLRLKGAVYELFRENSWHRGQLRSFPVARTSGDTYRLAPEEPSHWAEVWLQPLGGQNLVLPTEAVAVDIEGTGLRFDQGGVASLYGPIRSTLYYRVGLANEPVTSFPRAPQRDQVEPEFLDLTGVTPRIEEYSAEIMGEGTAAERAGRLERFLTEEYEYTLDLMGRSGEGLMESFLFEDRRGHCEYFATAMVLMLRSQGIPARVVTGFYGAEFSRRQDYYIVRQSNAHAWVEVLLEDEGWQTFDPTPPAGRPEGGSSWQDSLAQAWDAFIFRWDRYVLTYGLYDQVRAFEKMTALWKGFWKSKETPETTHAADVAAAPDPEEAEDDPFEFDLGGEFGALLLALALIGGLIVWWRRPRFSAGLAYTRLRQKLPDVERETLETLPPLEVRERFTRAYPEAAESAGKVFDLYLAENFGGRELDEGETDELSKRIARRSARFASSARRGGSRSRRRALDREGEEGVPLPEGLEDPGRLRLVHPARHRSPARSRQIPCVLMFPWVLLSPLASINDCVAASPRPREGGMHEEVRLDRTICRCSLDVRCERTNYSGHSPLHDGEHRAIQQPNRWDHAAVGLHRGVLRRRCDGVRRAPGFGTHGRWKLRRR